ncbi:GDP-mannose 4,6-dehydratase [Arenibacter algicola]|uniref:GDP-mannose 4,6-dehydratase n=1 Tax=Arenibacter algicola TaxID=616991 RepID=UPI002090F9BB|nr:GDP-mannose 4,6-dehydratase [Arenibacter algicola]
MKMEVHSKKIIFITGITGFTGKHLEEYYSKRGFGVYGTTFTEPSSSNHFKCDILEEEELFKILNKLKPEYIIHLAAISFVAAKDQKNIYNVNIFGTLSLLNALTKLDYLPTKILIASSAAVYGNIEGELGEELCPEPVNHYGNSKLVMENMVKGYYDQLNIIIARPFNYTGTGQENHFLIPKIVSHYKENKKEIELGNIDVYREFNDVHYVVRCYNELLFSRFKSDIFNVCSGNAININYILSVMNQLADYAIKVNVNPKFVRKNEIDILKGNPQKLFAHIGNFTEEYTLQSTLANMYNEE